MNKKGQGVILGIMLFVMVFIAAVQMIHPLKEAIVDARDTDKLDCANESIGFGQRSTCILVDSSLFYFFGAALVAGGAALGGRFIFQRMRSE